jgi:hypothetical protein
MGYVPNIGSSAPGHGSPSNICGVGWAGEGFDQKVNRNIKRYEQGIFKHGYRL